MQTILEMLVRGGEASTVAGIARLAKEMLEEATPEELMTMAGKGAGPLAHLWHERTNGASDADIEATTNLFNQAIGDAGEHRVAMEAILRWVILLGDASRPKEVVQMAKEWLEESTPEELGVMASKPWPGNG